MIDLKRFRKENKIPQKEIMDILDIQQPYLSAIENGKRPLSEQKFKILYNHYGDIILKYKLPDVVIEVKKEEYLNTVLNEPEPKYGDPPVATLLDMLKEKDAKLEEKEKEIRQLIKEVATLEAKLEIAQKGGYCMKEQKGGDVGCVAVK